MSSSQDLKLRRKDLILGLAADFGAFFVMASVGYTTFKLGWLTVVYLWGLVH